MPFGSEDIDALVTAESQAFFLNEMDGFAENMGIITLATSNHPERLDHSILECPSRFDRKYYFGPPGSVERLAYFSLWNDRFAIEMHLSSKEMIEMADLTEGFSFAYLKEMILSSLMIWMSNRFTGGMGQVMRGQAAKLREQMGYDGNQVATHSKST